MDLYLNDSQLETAITQVTSTEEGKLFLGHLISMSNAFSIGCNGNSKDIYLKGKADFGREIIELIKLYDIDAWFWLERKDIDKKIEDIKGSK